MLTFQAPPSGGGGSGGGGGESGGCDPFWCDQFAQNPNAQVPVCCMASPIIVDLDGDGFRLTDAQGGVSFDMDSDGYREGRMAWTAAGSDDAFLALDRNANGTIELGAELFGDMAPQPPSNSRNGFRALAEFDKAEEGGDGDGLISPGDEIYSRLRLWRDSNHDGVSGKGELLTLEQADIVRVELDYKESRRTDKHGNRFRYRAQVEDAERTKAGRWAWDVFLLKQ